MKISNLHIEGRTVPITPIQSFNCGLPSPPSPSPREAEAMASALARSPVCVPELKTPQATYSARPAARQGIRRRQRRIFPAVWSLTRSSRAETGRDVGRDELFATLRRRD